MPPLLPSVDTAEPEVAAQRRQRDILADARCETAAVAKAVARNEANPKANRAVWPERPQFETGSGEFDRPRRCRVGPEEQVRNRLLPHTGEARHAHGLATVEREVERRHFTARDAVRCEDDV